VYQEHYPEDSRKDEPKDVGTGINPVKNRIGARIPNLGPTGLRDLSITERFAQELDGPSSRMEERGRKYADLLVRLDSGIQTRLDLFDEQEESWTEDQANYLVELEDLASSADGALNSLEELVETIDPISKVSRSLRAPVRKMRGGLQGSWTGGP